MALGPGVGSAPLSRPLSIDLCGGSGREMAEKPTFTSQKSWTFCIREIVTETLVSHSHFMDEEMKPWRSSVNYLKPELDTPKIEQVLEARSLPIPSLVFFLPPHKVWDTTNFSNSTESSEDGHLQYPSRLNCPMSSLWVIQRTSSSGSLPWRTPRVAASYVTRGLCKREVSGFSVAWGCAIDSHVHRVVLHRTCLLQPAPSPLDTGWVSCWSVMVVQPGKGSWSHWKQGWDPEKSEYTAPYWEAQRIASNTLQRDRNSTTEVFFTSGL